MKCVVCLSFRKDYALKSKENRHAIDGNSSIGKLDLTAFRRWTTLATLAPKSTIRPLCVIILWVTVTWQVSLKQLQWFTQTIRLSWDVCSLRRKYVLKVIERFVSSFLWLVSTVYLYIWSYDCKYFYNQIYYECFNLISSQSPGFWTWKIEF